MSPLSLRRAACLIFVAVAFLAPVSAEEKAPSGDPFPLDVCPVMGKPFGDGAKTFDHEGRQIRVCCGRCVRTFYAEPAKFLTKIDAMIIASQKEHYPTDRCVVMPGETLGAGGATPVDFVHANRLVRICCDGCLEEFNKAPAKFLRMLERAVIRTQRPKYPLTVCVVSGAKLAESAVDVVIGHRLFRLASKDHVEALRKDVAGATKKLDDAAAKAKAAEGDE